MANYVPGIGPKTAKIVFVGEAPGPKEDKECKPFVGSAGGLLNNLLAENGIDRRECYLTNVVKYRPPNNDFSVHYLDSRGLKPTDELIAAREELKNEIREINPNIVVALGVEAMKALTPHRKISDWRGSVWWSDELGTKVLSTYHPAFLLRSSGDMPIVAADLRKARRHSHTNDWRPPTYNFAIQPTAEAVMEWLADAEDWPYCVFDLETVENYIRVIGLAKSPTDAICIPFMTSYKSALGGGKKTVIQLPGVRNADGLSYFSEDDEIMIWNRLNEILHNPAIPKIAQNYSFDATLLAHRYGIHVQGLWMDTMHLHAACWPELPKSLDFMCSLYTEQPYYADHDNSVDLEEWRYNCLDCVVTAQVAESLVEEAKELNVWEFYKNHIEPSMYALTRAQNRGILIDQEAREEMKLELLIERNESLDQLRQLAGDPEFNPNSAPQMNKLLYETLGLPKQYNRKTKAMTANREALINLRKKCDDKALQILDLILAYRDTKKIIEFLEDELDADGRIRTSYNPSGTVNGRISSSKSIFGTGANLQQMPKKRGFRRIFAADPGCTLVKVDLSQAEVRVVAWIAPIPFLKERLDDPSFDIHSWNASNIFDVPVDRVTKSQRAFGKIGVHGGNYGLGPRGAAAQFTTVDFAVTYADAKRSLDAYREALPELDDWWRNTRKQVNETRTIVSPLGRRRAFFGRLDSSLYRSAYSCVPQSVVGDVINRAISHAEYVLAPERGVPVLQVHDEIVFMVPTENLGTALPKIRALMEPPIYIDGLDQPPLVIPSEASIGPNWHDVKDVNYEDIAGSIATK